MPAFVQIELCSCIASAIMYSAHSKHKFITGCSRLVGGFIKYFYFESYQN